MKYTPTKFIDLPASGNIEIATNSSSTSKYIISSNVVLSGNVNINLNETPSKGATLNFTFINESLTDSGNTVFFNGVDITDKLSSNFSITSVYNGSTFDSVYVTEGDSFTLNDGDVTTAKLANASVTTAKIADDNITPSKLQDKYEVIEMEFAIISDVTVTRVYVPFYSQLEKIRWFCKESLNSSANDVNFSLNINGSSSSTTYPVKFATNSTTVSKGNAGTLTSTPVVGTDVLGNTLSDYIEISLSQTSNQGGSVTFFLILKRIDK